MFGVNLASTRRKETLSVIFFRRVERKCLARFGAETKPRRVYLNSLPSSRDGIDVPEVMEDALRRDPDALTLERGIGVASRLRGSLPDLSKAEADISGEEGTECDSIAFQPGAQ